MRSKIVLFLGMIASLASPPLYAQSEDILVTATRSKTPQAFAGGVSFDVISEEEINKKAASDLTEILEELPGIEIVANGGPGSSTSIFFRGADSKNVLVMIDGIMINDPSQANRGGDISSIDLSDVERVEIIRGSQSVLYGSNAQAGVINIITKAPSKEGKNKVKFSLGSYGTGKLSVNSKGMLSDLQYSLNLMGVTSDGISSANPRNPDITQDGNSSEADGWQNQKIGLKLGYEINAQDKLSLYLSNSRSIKEYDAYACGYASDRVATSYPAPNYTCVAAFEPTGLKQQRSDQTQDLAKLGYDAKFWKESLELSVNLAQANQQRLYYDNDDNRINDYYGDLNESSIQWIYKGLETQEITLGMGNQQETMTSYTSSVLDVAKNNQTNSLWVQDRFFALEDRLQVIVGARQDEHSSFGSASTYRLAPSYELEGGLKFKVSVGTGFRSPSLFELYSSYGNSALTPEESLTKEIGVEKKGEGYKIAFNLFTNEYSNRVDYDFATYAYNNLPGISEMQGLETRLKVELGETYTFKFNHTYLESQDADGVPLVRRAQNTSFWELSGGWGSLDAAINIRTKSKRMASPYALDSTGNAVGSLPAYALAGVRANYKSGSLRYFGKIENLTDQFYEEAWSYQQPGRNLELGLEAEF